MFLSWHRDLSSGFGLLGINGAGEQMKFELLPCTFMVLKSLS